MSSSPPKSRGITLVELLVTASIIAILGSVILFSLTASQEAAREAKTKALIATLHGLLMERYESYQTRRVPIAIPAGTSPEDVAKIRLDAIRTLMMYEIPARPSELNNVPNDYKTALVSAYESRKAGMTDERFGAELLYLVIMLATGDGEARALFKESDIGDTDPAGPDGAPEFLDGWGNPIRFIRWPAGFVSPLQTGDPDSDHDPFDPMKVDSGAYRLVPLIYSAGADGLSGLDNASNYDYPQTGGIRDPYTRLMGAIQDQGEAADNIHNHLIGTK